MLALMPKRVKVATLLGFRARSPPLFIRARIVVSSSSLVQPSASLLCVLSAQIDKLMCCEVSKQERGRGFDHSTRSNRYREAAVVKGARERER